ncbi:MAG: SusC/RagA family TonB-linked outer membrane protein [Phycisphaerales bacterium]|nr:SusC/RagA family TonB-linked outer membrane protein [Phycisphaerales bacterium]
MKLFYTTIIFIFLFNCCNILIAQVHVLSGTVTGKVSGQAIQGAAISYAGKAGIKKTVLTNVKGNFIITLPSIDSLPLKVSYIGYFAKVIFVNKNKDSIDVSLEPKTEELDEVVVTALGLVKSNRSLTYSATVVNTQDLAEARSPSIISGLEGKVAGVNISTSATGPTGASKVLIRGTTSINPTSTNQPLYVVDGIPIDNTNYFPSGTFGAYDFGDGIQLVDPDAIESFTILRGGAAGALYGYRAANGVILITSKKGNKNRAWSLAVNSNVTFQTPNIIPKWQYVYGHGDDETVFGGAPPSSVADIVQRFPGSWGSKMDGQPVIQYDGVYRPYSPQKRNIQDFYNLGQTYTNTISLSGGGDKHSFYFSATDTRNTGLVPNNSLVRDNFSLNGNFAPISILDANILVKYIRQRVKNRPITGDSSGNPNFMVSYIPTSWNVKLFQTAEFNPDGSERQFNATPYYTNPYWAANQFQENDQTDRWIAGFTPTVHFTDYLYLRLRGSLDYYTTSIRTILPVGTAYKKGGGTVGPWYDIKFREFNGEVLLGFRKTFKNIIGVDAILASNTQIDRTDQQQITNSGLVSPIPFYDVSNFANPVTIINTINKRVNSVYTAVELDYKKIVYLSFTGRNDWYSTLAPKNNSLFYPSVGTSLVLSEIIKMPRLIDLVRFRTSWGRVGGDRDPYQLSLYYKLEPPYNNNPSAIILNGTVPNAALLPYLVSTYEAGFQTEFLNHRLKLDLTYYDKLTTNDIVATQVSNASGFTSELINIGKVRNTGVEMLLTGVPIVTKDFSWTITYNFSYNNNKVIELASIDGQSNNIIGQTSRGNDAVLEQVVGLPAGQVFATDFLRDAQGNLILNNGVPQVSNEFVRVGTAVSPYTMGVTNEFSYRNFSLSFLIDAKFGGVVYSTTNDYGAAFGKTEYTLAYREDGVVLPGYNQNPDGSLTPNTTKIDAQTYFQNIALNIGKPFVYKSDFIKFRQIIFSYSIPQKLFIKTPFKGIVLSAVGRNIAILKKWAPNIDPEAMSNLSGQGIEYQGVPYSLSMGFNVNIKF